MADALSWSGKASVERITAGSGTESTSNAIGSHQRSTWRNPHAYTISATAAPSSDMPHREQLGRERRHDAQEHGGREAG